MKQARLIRRRLRLALLAPAILVVVAAWVVARDWWSTIPDEVQATYVGRQSCVKCHQKEFDQWTGSDHDRAMDRATPESVLGDFDNAELTYQGVTSRMFRRDGKYFIHTEGPDGQMADFEIAYTFGVRPLQQYMVAMPDGRVQVLRVSWNTEKEEWFYVYPPDVIDEKLEPGDPLHWTGVAQNWNTTCAECHSTDYHKNYDLAADRYDSKFFEIDVSCEACHGPGSVHVELAETKRFFWDRKRGYGLPKLKTTAVTRPFQRRPLSATRAEIETCAKCHSRRSQIHLDFSPGAHLLDYYEPSLLHESLYHADGQILDEVYVYGSFLQSKMFHQGVTCSDCHDPHSLRLRHEGNQLCTQCHQPGQYDLPAHHHHEPDTPGASCVECHMPARTYMVVDPRRDHSLRNPRPDLTVEIGTPNACNLCHTKPEENAQWAAEAVRKWYGSSRPDDPHYARALASARAGDPDGAEKLLKLLARRDTPERQTPDIVRATALSLLAQYPSDQSAAALEKALADRNPLIRTTAARFWSPRDGEQFLRKMTPLLKDPRRSVRLAVAERLVDVPARRLNRPQYEALAAAQKELRESLLLNSDRAAAHNQLGSLAQRQGDLQTAAKAFRTAIRVEPYLSGARSSLATVLEGQGADPTEVRRLRAEELKILERNVRQLPDSPVTHYRLGLMYHVVGQTEKGMAPLAEACRLDPGSYDYRLALTLVYERLKEWDKAIASVRLLAKLRPNDPASARIYQRIEATRAEEQ